jgi:pheromone shutdown protein TraB
MTDEAPDRPDPGGDPRVTGERLRTLPGPDGAGTVTLVGVVHDHPASSYRVRRVVADVSPTVLALEVPPLAVPLYEQYATDERTPPAFGGEMSAAVQAATTDRVVGIDGPTPGFVARLARTLLRERASLPTAGQVARGLLVVARTALVCRLAATLAALTSLRVEVDSPVVYDGVPSDDPARQAADEREHIVGAHSVLDALSPPRAVRFRDETREAHMAERLRELREGDDVVAVVGYGHLDGLVERLRPAENGP